MIDVSNPNPVMPRADREILVGWLDLQAVLRELLYQGEAAIRPLLRLEAIEKQAIDLLKRDPDESLFSLFQSLADPSLSYCATHALLSAVVCELSAEKLGTTERDRRVLFRAALTMNIGMARDQDSLAQQSTALLNDVQRKLIRKHPENSLAILQSFDVTDEDQLDIVRWHHEPDEPCGINRNLASRRLLRMADGFVAKMAARKTRLAMSPVSAAQSVFLGTNADQAKLASAMTTALGFYPPGTYVQLVNGEKAVSVQRGLRANHPQVVSIVSPGGMPLNPCIFRDTNDPKYAIRSPFNAEKIKIKVNLEQVLKARPGRTA
jgi:HD-GYP domain-containing protein (c-di-GMP phosphodiesterase class II)